MKSNIGITGIDSIRLGGKSMEELNFVERAHANQDFPAVLSNEREAQIKNVLAKYPKHSVEYLQSRIYECEENIQRVSSTKREQQSMISEYTTYIGLCEHRDKLIAKLDSENDADKIKELNKEFPPYNVAEMKKQINLCTESIERCDEVIAKEYSSIAELRKVMGLCEQRNRELRNLGAKVV